MVGWRWWCDEVMVVCRCGGGAAEVMDGGDDIGVVDVVVVAWWCCRGRQWCGEGRRQWPDVGRKKVTMVEMVDRGRSGPLERVVVVGCGGWPTTAVSRNPVTAPKLGRRGGGDICYINDLNQTSSEMKKELVAHQEIISIMSQEKEAQKKFHKTREDKELEKVIALENKIKVLDDIVYKTGQSVQTMNMLNRKCKTSFVKPEFLKKAQRANLRLYDIGCYNDNLALILAPESDEMIRLA
ncbi:hypothetical protein Tco_0033241 [Tanacetum coccineum]